jgi:hypothetical protein
MKFSIKLTDQEKRLIYERTLKDLEKRMISSLIACGFDPDAFDELNFTADEVDPGHVEIARLLDGIAKAKEALSSL